MDDERIKEMLAKQNKLGDDIYYTLRDNEAIRPLAGLWKSDGYGRDEAEERALKTGLTVAPIKIVEVVL